MLIIRRKTGESVVVDGRIVIEIVEVSRTRVKLGIRAPGDIAVVRGEAQAVARENRLASGFVATRGPAAVDEFLRVLRRASGAEPGLAPVCRDRDGGPLRPSISDETQGPAGPADMKQPKDTVGIAETARTHSPAR